MIAKHILLITFLNAPGLFFFHTVKCFQLFQSNTNHHHHHHHHVALVARISLTLSRHSSLSFIDPGRSSGQHPVSSHSCWMYVRAGRPAFARPCEGVHKSTSLMSSSLLLQQCPACLVRIYYYSFVYIQSNALKYCYVSLTIQLSINHSFTPSWIIKVLFQTILFTIRTQFKCQTVLFDPCHVLPLRTRVDLGAMARK